MSNHKTESMQWHGFDHSTPALANHAAEIVTWVNANGGEARYSQSEWNTEAQKFESSIRVRTRDGEAYCAPGQRVVKGDVVTVCEHGYSPATCRNFRQFREFKVED